MAKNVRRTLTDRPGKGDLGRLWQLGRRCSNLTLDSRCLKGGAGIGNLLQERRLPETSDELSH